MILLFSSLFMFYSGGIEAHPAAAGAAGASLTVHGDHLYMSWVEARSDKSGALKFARFDGDRWSEARTIVDRDDLFIYWADFPKLLVLDNFMITAWPQMLGGGIYDYGLRFSRSYDAGKTWSEGVWLHEDLTNNEYGFVTLAAVGSDKAGAVWLDGRVRERSGMQLRYRQIGSKAVGPEQVWDSRTCECCSTDLALTETGMLAAYRDRSDGEIRDIALAGPNRKPALVAEDGWKIHGCPVNGPALDSLGKTVAVAWFTAVGDHRLALAFSTDGGKSFGEPLRFSKGAVGRVDLALIDEKQAAVSWVDVQGDDQVIMLGRFTMSPTPSRRIERLDPVPKGRASGVPRLIRWRKTLVAAYQNPKEKGIRVVQLDY
ncbi:MAG: sialidase family protein [Acidobacteriota bacterium]|nr:sialidase family protein [Acidobacteriota bacterium]